MDKEIENKLAQIKDLFIYWDEGGLQKTPCGTDCSDIGTDCHGDDSCGGDV